MIRPEKLWTRMSGAGNTFILTWIDDETQQPVPLRPDLAKKLCREFEGFQTDGLIFLHDDLNSQDVCDFAWDFYNADGSSAEMCGNAARCAALFFVRTHRSKHGHTNAGKNVNLRFRTRAGIITAEVLEFGNVQVGIPGVAWLDPNLEIEIDRKHFKGSWLDTGVPHFVFEGSPDFELAEKIRNHPKFLPRGTNVTFCTSIKNEVLEAVTFERGVEDFTKACGTGAMAAALVQMRNTGLQRIEVRMPGGALQVNMSSDKISTNQQQTVDRDDAIFLTGPTQFEFEFQLISPARDQEIT